MDQKTETPSSGSSNGAIPPSSIPLSTSTASVAPTSNLNRYLDGIIDLSHPQTGQKTDWSTQQSAELYGIDNWGSGYFTVNKKGNVCVTPRGKFGPQLDLYQLMEDLKERGIRPPILVRFPDIIQARIELLANCFAKAINEQGYKGQYNGVFPIKVNQQKHVVSEIIKHGKKTRLGLECGSKPELLIGLAMVEDSESLIVVNGFKDTEYIKTALLAQKLGRNLIMVIDRFSEIDEVVRISNELKMKPKIGFRVKLDSKGFGKWVDSSGAKSKFGLTAPEIVSGIKKLKQAGMLDSLILLHFHIGSQVSSIQAFKTTLKEGARFFAEVRELGAPLKYVDVGGGLGVDYDGTGKGDNSVNYDEQEYANDVIHALKDICEQKKIPHPNIITESGRSLVAHHSLLIFNVLGVNELTRKRKPYSPVEADHQIIKDLNEIHQKLTKDNLHECYHDTLQLKNDALQLFTYGYLALEQRAKAEKLIWAIITKMMNLSRDIEEHTEIFNALNEELYDTYYCNFSIFQSVPDSWAVEQLFPVMPIHRLNEKPNHRAVLVDLTCDSDGKMDKFVEYGEHKSALRVHDFNEKQPYYLCCFLLGAYQEILGDLHNLFGDSDAVQVTINEMGYTLDHYEEGDLVTDVLNYVQYTRSELISKMRGIVERGITGNTISKQEARMFMSFYEQGLAGYTYLEDHE